MDACRLCSWLRNVPVLPGACLAPAASSLPAPQPQAGPDIRSSEAALPTPKMDLPSPELRHAHTLPTIPMMTDRPRKEGEKINTSGEGRQETRNRLPVPGGPQVQGGGWQRGSREQSEPAGVNVCSTLPLTGLMRYRWCPGPSRCWFSAWDGERGFCNSRGRGSGGWLGPST